VCNNNLEPTKLFGVIGHPIKQSLSPIIHNWAFRTLDLPYVYLKWEIPPDKLPELITAVRTLPVSGLSVTIPFKERIIPYLDELTEEASIVGAVNHIYWRDGKLWGNNTDVDGFLEPIKNMPVDSALLLGSGGAALACIYGLKKKGVKKIWVAGRDRKKLNYIQKKFSIETVMWDQRDLIDAQLLVNCTPLGMLGHRDSCPYPVDKLNRFSFVYDIVYNPKQTQLLKCAKEVGAEPIAGIFMFIYQALHQFKIWTSHDFDVKEAYNLLSSYLR
jgi:shikimate dehydrogenase